MFSSLRPSSQIYVLNKEGMPKLDIGSVVSVSTPRPRYGVMPQLGQQQEMVVDLTVKIGDKTGAFSNVPANAVFVEYENNGVKTSLVIATSRDAMNAEVQALRQRSLDTVNSVDFCREVISTCDEILREINPEYAEKQAQAKEIADLKAQMAQMIEMNRQLLVAVQSKGADSEGGRSEKNTKR